MTRPERQALLPRPIRTNGAEPHTRREVVTAVALRVRGFPYSDKGKAGAKHSNSTGYYLWLLWVWCYVCVPLAVAVAARGVALTQPAGSRKRNRQPRLALESTAARPKKASENTHRLGQTTMGYNRRPNFYMHKKNISPKFCGESC
jgi:hypothetical protein